MRGPFFLVDDHDIAAYGSLAGIEASIEPYDVEPGDRLFSSDGTELSFQTKGERPETPIWQQRVVAGEEILGLDPSSLAAAIRGHLERPIPTRERRRREVERTTMSAEELGTADLQQLVDEFIRLVRLSDSAPHFPGSRWIKSQILRLFARSQDHLHVPTDPARWWVRVLRPDDFLRTILIELAGPETRCSLEGSLKGYDLGEVISREPTDALRKHTIWSFLTPSQFAVVRLDEEFAPDLISQLLADPNRADHVEHLQVAVAERLVMGGYDGLEVTWLGSSLGDKFVDRLVNEAVVEVKELDNSPWKVS